MPRISEKPLRVIQIRIFEEDYQRLRALFPPGDSTVGMNAALRTVIHSFLTQTEAKMRQVIDEVEGRQQ